MTTAIDLFAGAGGFTTGAEAAGVRVKWAANHWRPAVDAHKLNHPNAQHKCQDLHQADWTKVPSTDLVLASPECKGHTKARGKDQAHHDASRATAWAVLSCIEMHEPKGFVVENVQEMLDWKLFKPWQACLAALGYRMTHRVLDAADFGVPQHRERMFLVGTRDVDFDIPTQNKAHVPASSVIDWPSGNWSMVLKPRRAANSIARWRSGRARFGDRFLAPYYGSGSGKTGRSLDRPIGTLTTKDRWALYDGDRQRLLTVAEQTALMGFPAGYKLDRRRNTSVVMLGNAVCPPVVTHILKALKEAIA